MLFASYRHACKYLGTFAYVILSLYSAHTQLNHFYLDVTKIPGFLIHRNLCGGIGIKLDCKSLGVQFDWTTNALRTHSDPMVLLYVIEIFPVALEPNKLTACSKA